MAISQRAVSGAPERHSMADQAQRVIRAKIIRCELEPGTRFTEAKLGQQLELGKTPVREALARLVQEGLVEVIPRQGYRVARVTLGDVQDLFGMRMIVEPAAVQLAAGHVDASQLRRLDELCGVGYQLGDHESAATFLRANTEFHVTVARASGNRRLTTTVARLLEESERLFHVGLMLRNRTHEMAHEHKELVDALVAGHGEDARRIAVEQIVAAQRMVVDAVLSSPALLEAPVGLTALPGTRG